MLDQTFERNADVAPDGSWHNPLPEETAAWELTLLARPWDFSLKEVSVPVRIWQGLSDNIVPPAIAQRLAAALPHSESRYLPDEGHLSLVVRHLGAVLAELRTAKEESTDG